MNVMAEETEQQKHEPFVLQWGEILGHHKQIRELRNMLAEGKLPHALLLSGPAGVGKKMIGRLLAAAILCEQPRQGKPCGACASCRGLLAGGHPDYYELVPEARGKGARLIHIEEIRELTGLAAHYPVLSDRRVLLIDEADAMNEQAANSLLKTLEEPPGQVTFILVTGARSALLDTIVSRCMPVSFGMLSQEDLQKLLSERNVPVQEAAELAALADGSIGRALVLYENGGLARRDEALAFLQQLKQMPIQGLWAKAQQMGEWEREPVQEWLLYFRMLLRDLLVLYEDGASPLLYHQDRREALLALLVSFTDRQLFALLDEVRELQRRLLANVNLRLQLEAFFLRLRDIV